MATEKLKALAEQKAREEIAQIARNVQKIMDHLGIKADESEEELPGEVRRRRQEEMNAQTATDQEAQNKRQQERREQEEARQRELQATQEGSLAADTSQAPTVPPPPSRQSEAVNQEKPAEGESKLTQAARKAGFTKK